MFDRVPPEGDAEKCVAQLVEDGNLSFDWWRGPAILVSWGKNNIYADCTCIMTLLIPYARTSTGGFVTPVSCPKNVVPRCPCCNEDLIKDMHGTQWDGTPVQKGTGWDGTSPSHSEKRAARPTSAPSHLEIRAARPTQAHPTVKYVRSRPTYVPSHH